MLETKRLILRRWEESDAKNLYEYAKDPDVGPIAGWPPQQSIAESRDVIRDVFNGAEAYAICFKSDGKAIGAIELKLNGHTDLTERDDECELGYWLGKPFWGQGIISEAAREMLRHAFEDLGGTVTVSELENKPVYFLGYVRKTDTPGETEAFVFAQVYLYNMNLGGQTGNAQSYDSSMRMTGMDPVFYSLDIPSLTGETTTGD